MSVNFFQTIVFFTANLLIGGLMAWLLGFVMPDTDTGTRLCAVLIGGLMWREAVKACNA